MNKRRSEQPAPSEYQVGQVEKVTPGQINSGLISLRNGAVNIQKSAQKAASNFPVTVRQASYEANAKTERAKQSRNVENSKTLEDPVLP